MNKEDDKYQEKKITSNKKKDLFSVEGERYKYLLEKIQFHQIQYDENIYEPKYYETIDNSNKYLLEENEYKIYERMNKYYKEKYLEQYYKNIINQSKDINFSEKNKDKNDEKEEVNIELINKKIKVNVLYDKAMYYFSNDPMVFATIISLCDKSFNNNIDEKTKALYKSILKSKINDYLDPKYIKYLEKNKFEGTIINENHELFNNPKFELLCLNSIIKKIYEDKFIHQFAANFFKYLENKYP